MDKDRIIAAALADWWVANLRKRPSEAVLEAFRNALVEGFVQEIARIRPYNGMFLAGFDGGAYGPVLHEAVESAGSDLLPPYRAGAGVYLDKVKGERIEAYCGWQARPAIIWHESSL